MAHNLMALGLFLPGIAGFALCAWELVKIAHDLWKGVN